MTSGPYSQLPDTAYYCATCGLLNFPTGHTCDAETARRWQALTPAAAVPGEPKPNGKEAP